MPEKKVRVRSKPREVILRGRQRFDTLEALQTAIRTYHAVYGVVGAEQKPIVKRWMKLCGFIPMGDILEAAAEQANVNVSDILSKKKDAAIVRARHVVVYMLMERAKDRVLVAKLIDRTPSLVDYALYQVENRMEVEGYELPEVDKK